MNRFALATLWAVLAVCLTGCGGYKLQGRVVSGEYSTIFVVNADDPRLQPGATSEAGVSGVSLRVETDPGRLRGDVIATGASNPDGSFSLPVDAFGAGLLEYEIGVLARRRGFSPAFNAFTLPASGKRLLIVLAPGKDEYSDPRGENVDDQLKRYGW